MLMTIIPAYSTGGLIIPRSYKIE